MEAGWFDSEAIASERLDADLEMAAFEAEGNRLYRQKLRSERLRAAGDLATAAEMCPHGGGYPLASLAAEYANDPGAGEKGYRCCDCGSRLDRDPFARDGGAARVLVPCEFRKGEEA